jgi:peptidoglycan/xylan/chitin deacetylase (PgdA/CDA1 family)
MTTKSAILTIDDSPSIHMGERVAFLASKGIPAVWFCRGDYLESRPEAAIQALREGCILGNHSFDHSYFSKLSIADAFEQIDRTERIIEDIHEKAGVIRRVKCFRFPYEERVGTPEHHAALQAGLKERGFVALGAEGVASAAFLEHAARGDVSWFWTYDSEDWKLVSPVEPGAKERLAAALSRMERDDPEADCGLNRSGTEIVILHDHDRTAGQWQRLVERLLAKGLRFTLPSGYATAGKPPLVRWL